MPSRIIPFVNGEYYHVFNRGVAKMPIFKMQGNFKRFIITAMYYQLEGPKPRFSFFDPDVTKLDQNKKLIEIICYCLMPNHFHFLLKQKRDGGITEFISKLSNSYTKYLNTKEKRVGPLLQGQFKAVHVETNEQLLHLSRYIHLNPLVDYVVKNLDFYPWSSYLEYIGRTNNKICSKDIVLGQFKKCQDYKRFVLDQEDYGKQLAKIKHQLLDLGE